MSVASAAGEMLFNRDEADILMHRPIEPCDSSENQHAGSDRVVDGRVLNAAGIFAGAFGTNGNWLFLLIHPISIGA